MQWLLDNYILPTVVVSDGDSNSHEYAKYVACRHFNCTLHDVPDSVPPTPEPSGNLEDQDSEDDEEDEEDSECINVEGTPICLVLQKRDDHNHAIKRVKKFCVSFAKANSKKQVVPGRKQLGVGGTGNYLNVKAAEKPIKYFRSNINKVQLEPSEHHTDKQISDALSSLEQTSKAALLHNFDLPVDLHYNSESILKWLQAGYTEDFIKEKLNPIYSSSSQAATADKAPSAKDIKKALKPQLQAWSISNGLELGKVNIMKKNLLNLLDQNAWKITCPLELPYFGLVLNEANRKKWDSIIEFYKHNANISDELMDLFLKGPHQFCKEDFCPILQGERESSETLINSAILVNTSLWNDWKKRLCDKVWLKRIMEKRHSMLGQKVFLVIKNLYSILNY